MNNVTFITGNQSKADYLSKYLGSKVDHQKVDIDEMQSMDLQTIVEHKARQAYEIVKKPVLVEDVSLEFEALGGLPGTFIKFYVEKVPFETICRTLDGLSRKATARCVFGYYDGQEMVFFVGALDGLIAEHPAGDNGFGWDKIFIPEGYDVTRASLPEEDDRKTYLRIKPFGKIKAFLEQK